MFKNEPCSVDHSEGKTSNLVTGLGVLLLLLANLNETISHRSSSAVFASVCHKSFIPTNDSPNHSTLPNELPKGLSQMNHQIQIQRSLIMTLTNDFTNDPPKVTNDSHK